MCVCVCVIFRTYKHLITPGKKILQVISFFFAFCDFD